MDIQVGDKIELIREGTIVTGVVDAKNGSFVTIRNVATFNLYAWDVEVLKRAYKLPTKPGIYGIESADWESYRLFKLSKTGKWSLLAPRGLIDHRLTDYGGDVAAMIFSLRWNLKRLVMED